MKEDIRKYTLQNAIFFKGKANPKAVLGKILSSNPELRKNIDKIRDKINTVVEEINAMNLEDQSAELEKLDPNLLTKEKKEKRNELPDLPGAENGKVVTRIPPGPNKYPHLGHAFSFLVNYMYAEKYHGKCVLRIEDTNPEKDMKEYADAMIEYITNYLKIKPNKIVYASDHIEEFYDFANQLVEKNQAYVCFCDREKGSELRRKGVECSCKCEKNQKELWKNMIKGKYEPGEAILRLNGDMKSKNMVMRDPALFRISKTEHYRQGNKFKAWPLYDFENSIMESIDQTTHILRSNEFGSMRTELQNYIKELLGLKKQIIIEYGRNSITEKITQGREIRKLIETKKVSGWDDPRLITLSALKRRGIQSEAYKELVLEMGLSKRQTNLDYSVVAAINRRILDKHSNRYFFISNPKEITIHNAPHRKIKLKLHPDFPERGDRVLESGFEFLIDPNDYKKLKENKIYRLMDNLNFIIKDGKYLFISEDVEEYKSKKNKGLIIHWLNKDHVINAEIIDENNEVIEGLCEPKVKTMKVGEICQFERFGYCKLEHKSENILTFIFSHK